MLVAHVDDGGVLHVTLLHGSLLHCPFEQPNVQVLSEEGYWHEPPEQPAELYVRNVELVVHVDAGGLLQVMLKHGSLLHLLFEQPNWHVCVEEV